jgi:hypothetical protein
MSRLRLWLIDIPAAIVTVWGVMYQWVLILGSLAIWTMLAWLGLRWALGYPVP